ncbi:MAG: hypothetical protein ABJC10_01710 [Acidobacteriota bacterium]
MIPQRMFVNRISVNGLRERVTACRKRLRDSRVMLKAHAGAPVVEPFTETRTNCSPFAESELEEAGALLELETQEVGIT